MQWNLAANSGIRNEQFYSSESHAIDSVEVHGDVVTIVFDDDTFQYRRLNGLPVPLSIECHIPKLPDDYEIQCRWMNFSDGTHVIEHRCGVEGKHGFSILRPGTDWVL